MITKYVTYDKLNTKELGLRLVDDIELESSSNSTELIEIDGVNGAKIKDNKRLNVVERAFPFKIYDEKANVETIISKLNDYLINIEPKWYDFELSWDSDYLYKAYFFETFKIEGTLTSKKKCILNFKLSISNGQVLVNPEKRTAKPLIKLRGTGDINLNINSQIFRLKGVSGHIVIDCETQSAHWDNKEPQYDKVFTYPFPHLEIGDNTISWDNNSFVVEITPRWEALV